VRVLHCCLAAFYIDDFGYQENVLPRVHRDQGHEVMIVASTETYLDRVNLGYAEAGTYLSTDSIRVTRLPYLRWLPEKLARKLRIYRGLQKEIESFRPDVLFLHDCQFLSIVTIVRYARRNGTAVYVDCHTDLVNSARSWLSRVILHGMLYRACARWVAPVTRKFYATLPLRADFLEKVYGVSPLQIELLPFGVDDDRIDFDARDATRSEVRRTLRIGDDQVVFATGGKIDRRKNIHALIDSFITQSDSGGLGDAVLIVFGEPEPGLRDVMARAARHERVRVVGWVAAENVHRYLWAADVAIFPGTHSVLWEEAVGLGLPCVFKRWPGIEHVDLGGNCLMLDLVTDQGLDEALLTLATDRAAVGRMREVAEVRGREEFSYSRIARKALGQC
jgi:1,2-diacylglycerol 3-alpha-glucosyltransferase